MSEPEAFALDFDSIKTAASIDTLSHEEADWLIAEVERLSQEAPLHYGVMLAEVVMECETRESAEDWRARFTRLGHDDVSIVARRISEWEPV